MVAAWVHAVTLRLVLRLSLQVSNGVWFYRLKLTYVDHLLQDNVTAVGVCKNPGKSPVPMMACKGAEVLVKVPVGTKVKRVATLGEPVVWNVTSAGAAGEYVKISTAGQMVWRTSVQLRSSRSS